MSIVTGPAPSGPAPNPTRFVYTTPGDYADGQPIVFQASSGTWVPANNLKVLTGTAVVSGQNSDYTSPAGSRALEVQTNGDVLIGENTNSDFYDFKYRSSARRLYIRSMFLYELADPVDLTIARGGQPTAVTTGTHNLPIVTLNVVSTGAVTTAFETSKTISVAGRVYSFTGMTATSFTGLTLISGSASGSISAGSNVLQDNYPYGPLIAGIKAGTNLGNLGWRGAATTPGGTPGVDVWLGMAGSGDRSAAIAAYSAEDFFPSAAGTELRFYVTPNGSGIMDVQMTLGNDGKLKFGPNGNSNIYDASGTLKTDNDFSARSITASLASTFNTAVTFQPSGGGAAAAIFKPNGGATSLTIDNNGRFDWSDCGFRRISANLIGFFTGDLRIETSGRYLQWGSSGNEQTTVGAAGGASALPATPTKYLKVKDSTGAVLVIPAYAP